MPDSMWLVIADKMTAIAFSRSPAECLLKWDSLVDAYERIKKGKKKHTKKGQKRWQYFHAMEVVELVRGSGRSLDTVNLNLIVDVVDVAERAALN